jgi:hypothetical protein
MQELSTELSYNTDIDDPTLRGISFETGVAVFPYG